MKAQFFALSAIAATVAVSSLVAPAQAFSFGTNGIKFDSDTQVDFTFLESHGSYTSALNVFEKSNLSTPVAKLFWETKGSDNGSANEWGGSFGKAVTSATGVNKATYLFKANVEYTLGLFSGSAGTVYSTNALNTGSGGSQQAIFGSTSQIDPLINGGKALKKGAAGNYVAGSPFAAGGAMISFDDRGGGNDADFQDFSVRAEAVPEPFTMGGIALAGAGMTFARRRQQQKRQSV